MGTQRKGGRENKPANSDTLQTVELTFNVIESLLEEEGAGVSEIARSLNVPKSTIHIHLQTLLQRGYVTKKSGKYELSFKLLEMGDKMRNGLRVTTVSKEGIRNLAEETGEIANLTIEEGGKVVRIVKEEGANALDDNSHLGDQYLMHASSAGKATLAHLSENQVQHIIDEHGLPELTQNTITDLAQLNEELNAIREHEFAINDEETSLGIRAIGTVILDEDNTPVGSISISGPTKRLTTTRLEGELRDLLLETRNVIELRLKHYD